MTGYGMGEIAGQEHKGPTRRTTTRYIEKYEAETEVPKKRGERC
jgi:hypothetical protein